MLYIFRSIIANSDFDELSKTCRASSGMQPSCCAEHVHGIFCHASKEGMHEADRALFFALTSAPRCSRHHTAATAAARLSNVNKKCNNHQRKPPILPMKALRTDCRTQVDQLYMAGLTSLVALAPGSCSSSNGTMSAR